jgi:hypothetical protein
VHGSRALYYHRRRIGPDRNSNVTRRTAISALILLVVASTAWMVACSARWQPGFDEWWHVWFGEVQPWACFWREILGDTHPPVTYLALRGLSAPGDPPLWARLASVVPAAATLPCFYAAARAAAVAPAAALVGTAALAFSHAFVAMGVCVRAYAAGTFFATAAAAALAHAVVRPTRAAAWLAAGAAVLTGWTAYSSVLAAAATGAAAVLAALGGSPLLRRWRDLVGPALVLVAGYALLFAYFGATRHASITNHLSEFVRRPGAGALEFVLRGANLNLESFSPLRVPRDGVLAPALVVAAWAVLSFLAWRRRQPARLMLVLSFGIVVVLMAVAGTVRSHPWGGKLRHQYALFVPAMLFLTIAVDAVRLRLRPSLARAALLLAFAGAAAWGSSRSYAGPHADEFLDSPLWATEYAELARRVRDGDVVHVNRFAQIGLYANARAEGGWRWRGSVAGDGGAEGDLYDARIGGKQVTVLLQHGDFSLPADPVPWAARAAALAAAASAPELLVFALAGPGVFHAGHPQLTARALADAGFTVVEQVPLAIGLLARVRR